MKKGFLVFIFATIPLLFFAGVWQAYTFQSLEAKIADLETQQNGWFEANKRKIIGIESLSSPRRLDQIAREELELKKVNPEDIIRVVVSRDMEADDG